MKAYILFAISFLLACNPDKATIPDEPVAIDHTVELTTEIQHSEYKRPPSCPEGMILISDSQFQFCIDQYEYPNIKGVLPPAAMDEYEAERLVEQSGKRLCTIDEWERACEGKHHYIYSYGPVYRAGVCNDNKSGWVDPHWGLMFSPQWKSWALSLYKGEPSGNRPGCITDEGVVDMTGNVREWVQAPKSEYGYVVMSGYWFGTMAGPPTCTYQVHHARSFASYEFGVRACKDTQ